MFSNNLLLLLLLITTSAVHALYTPRNRFMHARHAAIHARLPTPQPVSAPQPVALPLAQASAARVKAKRSSKKCKPRPTSISPSASPSPSAVPVNVGQDPASQVESPKATPSPQAHQPPPPSSPPPPVAAPAPAPPPPKPTTTTHAKPPPSPAPPPPPAPKPPSSGGSNLPFSGNFFPDGISGGDGTFYTPGLGACGGTNNENQDVVAIPFGLWDQVPGWDGANPNNNPICGKSIDITYQGKTVTAVVVDECMGCTNNGSCDMSPHAFNQLADPSLGRIHGISWKWHT